jgi:hypothetical protein
MDLDIKSLIAIHREKDINKMQVGQLRKLHREIIKGKGKGSIQENLNSSSGNLGINTNPLKNPKKIGREEKRKGHKPHRQVLEEAGELLIDFGQVVRLMYNSFLPQPIC